MKAHEIASLLSRVMGISVVMFLTHRLLPLGARLYSEIEYPSKSQQDLVLFLILHAIGILALLLVGAFLVGFSNTVSKWMLRGCDADAIWCAVPKRDFSEMIYSLLGGIFLITLMTQFTYVWIQVFESTLKENFISFFGIWLQLAVGIYLVLGPAKVSEKVREYLQWGHRREDFG